MGKKAAFVAGGVVGYFLATRTGRARVQDALDAARSAWQDPRVQESVSDASQRVGEAARAAWQDPRVRDAVSDLGERAGDFARAKAPDLKDAVSGAARAAADSVRDRADRRPSGDS